MSLTLKQYSSGVRSIEGVVDSSTDLSPFKVLAVKGGDPEVVEILKQIGVKRLHNISSIHKLELIDCAKRLFGNFDVFVGYNITTNSMVHGPTLDFLIDTIEFVNGRPRELSIETWTNYLDQYPKKPTTIPDRRVFELPISGPNYIAKWIRQPNGFQDLVATLILLFGLRTQNNEKAKYGLL